MIPNKMNPMGLDSRRLPTGYTSISRVVVPAGAWMQLVAKREVGSFSIQCKSLNDVALQYNVACVFNIFGYSRYINIVKSGAVWAEIAHTMYTVYTPPAELGFSRYEIIYTTNNIVIKIDDVVVKSRGVYAGTYTNPDIQLFAQYGGFCGEVGDILIRDVDNKDIFDLQGCLDRDGIVCFYDHTTKQTHYSKGLAFDHIA